MPTKLNPDMGTIGDVKYSILPPTTFKKYNGDGWRLMNGQNIEGTQLATVAKRTHLPDASNNFIRCLDPKDKNRQVGSVQNDATRMPHNRFVTNNIQNTHKHPNTRGRIHSQPSNPGPPSGGGRADDFAHRENTKPIQTYTKDYSWTHNHIINGGDPETRPKNIALYIYIKVN